MTTATQSLIDTMTPGHILMVRFSFGSLAVLAIFLVFRPKMPSREHLPKAVGLGVFGMLGFNIPVAYGIEIMGAGASLMS